MEYFFNLNQIQTLGPITQNAYQESIERTHMFSCHLENALLLESYWHNCKHYYWLSIVARDGPCKANAAQVEVANPCLGLTFIFLA